MRYFSPYVLILFIYKNNLFYKNDIKKFILHYMSQTYKNAVLFGYIDLFQPRKLTFAILRY
jgi:hypothetical protein